MDPKVVLVVVFLSALAITSTNAGIPRCCIRTTEIPRSLLLKTDRWERQYSSGVCDIDAVMLYMKDRLKPICIDLRLEPILKRIQKIKQRQQAKRT